MKAAGLSSETGGFHIRTNITRVSEAGILKGIMPLSRRRHVTQPISPPNKASIVCSLNPPAQSNERDERYACNEAQWERAAINRRFTAAVAGGQ